MYSLATATVNFNYWVTPVSIKENTDNAEIFMNAQDVINTACSVFQVARSMLISKSRKKELVRIRIICMYIMRQKVKFLDKKRKQIKPISLKKIGSYFNRDHTTVLHALDAVENELSLAHMRQQMNEDLSNVLKCLN